MGIFDIKARNVVLPRRRRRMRHRTEPTFGSKRTSSRHSCARKRCLPPSRTNEQETQTTPHRPSNYLGSIAAWLCLAPAAFASQQLAMPSKLVPASTLVHYILNMPILIVWISGGIFLSVSGFVAFAPFRFCAHNSSPFSCLERANWSAEIILA
jgi:hypothetical protein